MAGPFTIQRLPKGLLDFLAMKGSGQTPTELEDRLRSVIDTTPLYLADRQAGLITSTPNIAADGQNFFVSTIGTVPNGEVWLPIVASVQRDPGGLTAGNDYQFWLAAKVAQFPTVIFPGPSGRCLSPGGGYNGYAFDRLVMQPGDRFSIFTQGTYAGTNALVFNLWYYRLFI